MMLRAFAILTVGIARLAHAQQGGGSTGAQCIESLEIPQFPVVARLARISGVVHTRAVVSGGTAKAIEIDEDTNPLLREAVSKSLTASRFSLACDKTRLEIVFAFVIQGDPVSYQDAGLVTFRWPNQFTISVRPRVPVAEVEKLEGVPTLH